jgi:hypothetical protein
MESKNGFSIGVPGTESKHGFSIGVPGTESNNGFCSLTKELPGEEEPPVLIGGRPCGPKKRSESPFSPS